MSAQARVSWVRLPLTTGFFTSGVFALLYVRQDLLSHLGPSPIDLLLKKLTIFNADM